ncbi:beta-1,3-galactosyltransferase 2-like [Eleutherodactylus coqui]|uniref:beta-1,3-galactosyltransferase 2-like n=1 Tax=Eleutherodactylus coqui TaxID=57060 RepID=UPI00346357CE
MELNKKISFSSASLLVLALLCIIALGSLFVAYQYYQEGHFSYQENAGRKKSPETLEKNENGLQWIEKTLSTPSASSVGYLNIRSYPYIINESNKCKEESPFLIVLIATIASEVENRRAIRATFGKKTLINGTSIICMFLLGKDSKQKPKSILEESEKYHDIIQKDFQDTYKNLTIKTLMGIEWVCNYCPTAKYVMKTDSDMFVNIDRLLDLLKSEQAQKQNYFTGDLMKNNRPIRNKNSKWHMPHSLYPGEFYPTFCTGSGYVFSGDVAAKILRSSFKVKFLYLEDVFVGICLDREGIKITRPPTNNLFNSNPAPFNSCVYNNIITSHNIKSTQLIHLWKIVQENKERCSNSQRNQ